MNLLAYDLLTYDLLQYLNKIAPHDLLHLSSETKSQGLKETASHNSFHAWYTSQDNLCRNKSKALPMKACNTGPITILGQE